MIRHSEIEVKPRAGERYRCPTCRLTLDFDGTLEQFVVPPFETDHQSKPPAERSRRLPPPVASKPRKPKPPRSGA